MKLTQPLREQIAALAAVAKIARDPRVVRERPALEFAARQGDLSALRFAARTIERLYEEQGNRTGHKLAKALRQACSDAMTRADYELVCPDDDGSHHHSKVTYRGREEPPSVGGLRCRCGRVDLIVREAEPAAEES